MRRTVQAGIHGGIRSYSLSEPEVKERSSPLQLSVAPLSSQYSVMFFTTNTSQFEIVRTLIPSSRSKNTECFKEKVLVLYVGSSSLEIPDLDVMTCPISNSEQGSSKAIDCAHSILINYRPSLLVSFDPCSSAGSLTTIHFLKYGIPVLDGMSGNNLCPWGGPFISGVVDSRQSLVQYLNATERFCM